eukprot:TRINITY_DN5735_c0_g1_i2.p1 TRINITY_DN5735_c0_g1~~TRINITY_DN5735_c0_g1_i2.p1  ORF type:complete len:102 (-),score=3.76 TRINITY_DN5735_c0_g1_i2:381-686(-)
MFWMIDPEINDDWQKKFGLTWTCFVERCRTAGQSRHVMLELHGAEKKKKVDWLSPVTSFSETNSCCFFFLSRFAQRRQVKVSMAMERIPSLFFFGTRRQQA